MSTSHAFLKIAIIGGGPVSLALANILQNNDIDCTIFEASSSFRTSGGSLDLHPQSGQLALREAGLWQAFMDNARPEADCDKIVNIDGQVLWDDSEHVNPETSGEERFDGRPEIDRRLLMEILFKNLRDDKVVFGKKLREVQTSSSSAQKYNLKFDDGSQQADFDLVVGGDGAWSKVRQFLTPTKPQYSGISMVEVWCQDSLTNSWLRDYVGKGTMFAFGQDRAVIAQTQGDNSIRTYAALRAPEDFLSSCGIDWSDSQIARKQVVERYFSDIGEDLKRVVYECNDSLTPRALYELPIGFTWQHCAGVTLIGDAAHVMTPFAGVGVNVGLTDALVLAREIVKVSKGEVSLDQGLQTYETEMQPRAKKNAEKTERGKEGHLSKNGAKEFADMLRMHRG